MVVMGYRLFAVWSILLSQGFSVMGQDVIGSGENFTYIFSQMKENWTSARDVCQQMLCDLAVISPDNINNVNRSILPDGTWIGARNRTVSGWQWVNGDSLDLSQLSNMPTWAQRLGNCLQLWSDTSAYPWTTEDCRSENHFICECPVTQSMSLMSKKTVALIAGIVAAVAFIIIVAIITGVCLYNRKHKEDDPEAGESKKKNKEPKPKKEKKEKEPKEKKEKESKPKKEKKEKEPKEKKEKKEKPPKEKKEKKEKAPKEKKEKKEKAPKEKKEKKEKAPKEKKEKKSKSKAESNGVSGAAMVDADQEEHHDDMHDLPNEDTHHEEDHADDVEPHDPDMGSHDHEMESHDPDMEPHDIETHDPETGSHDYNDTEDMDHNRDSYEHPVADPEDGGSDQAFEDIGEAAGGAD